MLQYDWLKGNRLPKVVWLPNETDCSYCEFVVPILPICSQTFHVGPRLLLVPNAAWSRAWEDCVSQLLSDMGFPLNKRVLPSRQTH